MCHKLYFLFKNSLSNRNYKVLYDPELDTSQPKRSNHLILQYEEVVPGRAKDPRNLQNTKGRLYNTLFEVVSFPVSYYLFSVIPCF